MYMGREILPPMQAHIIVDIAHPLHLCNIGADYLRIISHHRTIIVIVAHPFVQVVRHAWVENRFDPRVQQRLDVPVHQLCRETNRVRWNGCLPFQIQLTVRCRRGDHLKAQLSKKRVPKW